jgi:hypothetical protein
MLYDEDGEAMKGLFAASDIPQNTIIDLYFGLVVAFTEDSVSELRIG